MMKHSNVLLSAVFLLLLPSLLNAQSPGLEWQVSLGGSKRDEVEKVIMTPDGNFVFVGSTFSQDGLLAGFSDTSRFWVVKMNQSGEVIWQNKISDTILIDLKSIVATSDDRILLGGASSISEWGGWQGCIVKLDASGGFLWYKHIAEMSGVAAITQSDDGGYILVGDLNSGWNTPYGLMDYGIVKVDSLGNLQWVKQYGGTGNDVVTDVKRTLDNNYIVVGYAFSNDLDVTGAKGGFDFWVLKVDTAGDIIWQKNYGGSQRDEAYSVALAQDGGYFIAGSTDSDDGDVTGYSGSADQWVIRIDAIGNLLWERTFGSSNYESLYHVTATDDGGCIVSGLYDEGWPVYENYSIDKLNADGTSAWGKSLRGEGVGNVAKATFPVSGGGYVVFGNIHGSEDIWANGDVETYLGGGDVWIVKLDPSSGIANDIFTKPLTIYPNPTADDIVYIDDVPQGAVVECNNMNGEKLIRKTVQQQGKLSLSLAGIPDGIYIITIRYHNQTHSQKIIIARE